VTIPPANRRPDFDITRASHVALAVRDLAASVDFYTQVLGLVLSDREGGTAYLRGVEEVCHHSLTLTEAAGAPACLRTGLRLADEDEVDRAAAFFRARGLPVEEVRLPFCGRALHASDPDGTPLELVARMETRPRAYGDVASHRGAPALRFDHFQILVPDPEATARFYAELGFRTSDYIQDDASGEVIGFFMFRKDNPHDLVFFRRPGPVLHHFGYFVSEPSHIFRACDIAGQMGFGEGVERGPGRHGLGHSLFVYLRDPDGHRVELLPPAVQMIDREEEPVRWSASNGFSSIAWGLPAQRRWFEEVTPYQGVGTRAPAKAGSPMTLERYLQERA
jgi:catechol 2,3-dioxygenase